MKNILLIFILFSVCHADATTRSRSSSRAGDNTISLGVTHLLPSAFVIPGGTLVLGTTVGAGFFDLFDITTNLYLDFYNVFNVAGKVNLFATQDFAMAIHASYVSQTYTTTSVVPGGMLEVKTTAVAPGATFSYRILPSMTGHIGGKIVTRNPALPKEVFVPKTGFVQGSTINKEFAFGLSPETALAVGGSYDLTYDIPGAGLSFYLGHFQLGAHYYFGVTDGAIQPLIGGSYSTTF
jgi:hypothetical protein